MKQFTESHLGVWKKDYLNLLRNERFKLIDENIWMLGKTDGLICFFLDQEISYICYSKSIHKTLKDILDIKKNNELIRLIMIHDLEFSENKINQKKLSKPAINKLKKIINNFEFSLVKIKSNQVEKITDAFIVVSDPTYNGYTSRLNKIIDNIPKK
ncbi:MAG: hypothetical protein CL893_02815 [Dehalococcoidia bacterium]|nr:hypothetical protein [Dehalococcoidia bacterium]|tara:strand:- start:223 stop:690 length:468 start_codon:yes stop_codon:yes gene_type:complete